MQILELRIKNFGKFTNKTVIFHPGINVIYGSNEMGKTTLHSFIRGMLFGIEKLRGRGGKNDEYRMREPWDNPGYFAGVMRFESGGKVFRLERNFQKKEKSVQLVCETDGEELSAENGDLEVLLEDLNEAAFRNTFYIRQKSSATDENLADELRAFMSNVQRAGAGEIDVSRAIQDLEGQRRKLEQQQKNIRNEQAQRRLEMQSKLDYVQQEISELERELTDSQAKLASLSGSLATVEKQKEKGRRLKHSVMAGGGFGFLLLLILISDIWVKMGVILLAALLAGFIFWRCYRISARSKNRDGKIEAEQAENYRKQQWNWEHSREILKEKRTMLANLKEGWEEIQEEDQETERRNKEIEAIQLAIHVITTASDELYRSHARKLNCRISDILSEITAGKYNSIYLDADLQVRINTPDKLLGLEQVSRGTMDQIYFALRMAVGELLCKEAQMPVILDDAFAMYDEERLRRTLKWLKDNKRQVLLFTCHRREEEILRTLL